MAREFLPVLIALVVAVVFAASMLGMAAMMGARSRTRSGHKLEPYESGMPPIGSSRKRISIKFYLVALVFVVLDVEIAFLYPWAITFRNQLAKGPTVVMLEILAFIAPLATVYAYIWKKGVFDWTQRRRVTHRRDRAQGSSPPSE